MITIKKFGGNVNRKQYVYDTFLSVDFGRASANLEKVFSPDAVNMIRDEYGKVRRRMGYEKVFTVSGKVWGMTRYNGYIYVHAGTNLYKCVEGAGTPVTLAASGLAQSATQWRQSGGKLYILDGTELWQFNGTTLSAVVGKIPTVTINTPPKGGGTQFEQFNLISDYFTQGFIGDGTSTVYHLVTTGLMDYCVIKTASLDVNGNVVWTTMSSGYTLNAATGTVTFTTAPGAPVVAQEDNVLITIRKNRTTERWKITHCSVSRGFGVNGYDNQWFLSGNPSYKNHLYWSAINDITYWGDLQYAVLGQDDSAIMALNSLSNQLVAHKDDRSGDNYILSVYEDATAIQNIIITQISVDKVIHGAGCIAKYTAQQFGEPVILSTLGINAIAYRDISGLQVETLRGERVTRKLLAEPNIQYAASCVWKYYYFIAVNGNVYVLDRLNPVGENNVLNNIYQYNAFFWNHVPATAFFPDGDHLYFGTADGKIMRFYTNENESTSYNDDGVTYSWSWTFPEFVGDVFYMSKCLRHIAIRAKASVRTTLSLSVQLEGQWSTVTRESAAFGYWDFNDINLANLSFSTDATPKKVSFPYSQNNFDKISFKLYGSTINEPFGLYSFAFETYEKGYHK
ncbi:MAG: hypothetical protein VB118_04810 [Oscillospiraceae bacterium]|nr:hypothetical protein [Oscillospiraceae bacterium]